MFELFLGAGFVGIAELLTIGVVGVILLQGQRAYRITGEPYLINFFLGFSLLAISSVFVALHVLLGSTPPIYNDTLWIHQTTQTAGFALIALSYYLKDRNPTFRRAVYVTLVTVGSMSVAIVTYLAVPLDLAFAAREALDDYLYVSSFAFLCYVLFVLASNLRTSQRISNAIVPAAFGILAVGQVSRILWAISNAGLIQSEEGWVVSDGAESIAIYDAFIMLSFMLFAISLVALWRRPGRDSTRKAG